MERLTTEILDPYAKEKHFTLKDCPDQCSRNCFGCKVLMKAIDRLAAYENTGLEPEEVKEFVRRWKRAIEIEKLCEKGGIKRLLEFDQAERDGRLVVLPSEDYTFKIRGDLALGIIRANCRAAREEA